MPALQGDTLPGEDIARERDRAHLTPFSASVSAPIADSGDPLRALPGFGSSALLTIVWDDGSRHVVRAPTLFGRRPGAVPGWLTVAVRDETLSLSRTHVAIGGRPGEVWVADTGSTNGVEICRGAERHRIAPGERWMLRSGDILEFGDRRVSVEGV